MCKVQTSIAYAVKDNSDGRGVERGGNKGPLFFKYLKFLSQKTFLNKAMMYYSVVTQNPKKEIEFSRAEPMTFQLIDLMLYH